MSLGCPESQCNVVARHTSWVRPSLEQITDSSSAFEVPETSIPWSTNEGPGVTSMPFNQISFHLNGQIIGRWALECFYPFETLQPCLLQPLTHPPILLPWVEEDVDRGSRECSRAHTSLPLPSPQRGDLIPVQEVCGNQHMPPLIQGVEGDIGSHAHSLHLENVTQDPASEDDSGSSGLMFSPGFESFILNRSKNYMERPSGVGKRKEKGVMTKRERKALKHKEKVNEKRKLQEFLKDMSPRNSTSEKTKALNKQKKGNEAKWGRSSKTAGKKKNRNRGNTYDKISEAKYDEMVMQTERAIEMGKLVGFNFDGFDSPRVAKLLAN